MIDNGSSKTWPLWRGLTRWLMNNGYEQCQLCPAKTDLTFDHILPTAQDGKTIRQNLAILCARCNEAKGNRYMMELDPIAWPRPSFGQIEIQNLTVGHYTVYGRVTGPAVEHFNDGRKVIIEVPTDGKGITAEIKKINFGPGKIFRPSGTIILLHPEDEIEGTRMACSTGSHQTWISRATFDCS
jgi:ribosomal protein L3